MDIHLTPELERMVQSHLDSGHYSSPSDVVRTALFLMQAQAPFEVDDVEDIRNKIEEGWQSLQRGEVLDGEAVFDEIEAELKALIRAERA